MSKGKKSSKATPDAVSWDEGLLNATVREDNWRPYLVFACPNTPHDEPHIEALVSAVSAGSRRRFTVINKTAMLQSASEDVKLAQAAATSGGGGKKSKAGAVPPLQKPMFVEVCEQVVDVMKSGSPLPPSLLAKMIKYKVLRHKAAHQATVAQREAEEAAKKQAAEKGEEGKGGKGGKGGGRTSKVGKKGKETPAVDASPAIPLPEKLPTSMRKRGEEDLDSKYIDDEPVDGPTCYFIMTGFTSLALPEQLAPVGLTAHVLMNMTGGLAPPETQTNDDEVDEDRRKEEEQHKSELIQFWRHLGQRVKATKNGHMLRDMAQVEVTLPQPLVPDTSEEREAYGQTVFDAVSQSVYRAWEQSIQYQHYINYLNLRQLSLPGPVCEAKGSSLLTDISCQSPLPTQSSVVVERAESSEPPKVDLKLYTNLLSSVPQNAVTIPLILHCMEEQVCATLSAVDANSPPSQEALHHDVLAQMTDCITGLCIPTSAKRSLLPGKYEAGHTDTNGDKVTTTIEHYDQIKLLSHHLPDSKLLNIRSSQANTNSRALLGAILNAPLFSTDEQNSHLAQLHAVQLFCTSAEVSAQLFNHALLVLSLEHVHLPNASSFPDLNRNAASLLFDFPFDIAIREKCKPSSESTALVPYVNGRDDATSVSGAGERAQCRYELDLSTSYSFLAEHSVCEPMSKDSLLQLLQSLQYTHPYLSVYNHMLSQSTLIVAHSGFDGQPLHSYTWQSLAHSHVGFNNYLQHIAQQFGDEIDRAVEEDEERREAFKEEQQTLIKERKKELEQHQQQLEKQKEEHEEPKASAKGGKKSVTKKTPSGRKSKLDTTCTTPEPASDVADIETGLPEFEERDLFEAYDVGDTVLLNKGSVSVQFVSDGSQIHTEKTEKIDSDTTITVSAISNGHVVSCSMIKREVNGEEDTVEGDGDGSEEENRPEEEKNPKVVVAGIPQPPPGVAFASLTAEFRDSLYVSVSHFGPQGNGELPFEPPRPDILLEPVTHPDSSGDSRPQSRQTPQKMSKKQMEQQQQLLEQQRQLEEQKKRKSAEAKEKYDAQCSALLRQNKYQQLYASTPYGLHIHCQVSVDLNADSTLTDGSDGSVIVKQNYPIESQGSQESEASFAITAYNEAERYYLPDGSVLRFMKDGSIIILCPDGHVYQTATKSLTDLYHQQLQEQGSGGATQEDVSTETPLQTTFSDTKVTFAEQLDKITAEDPRRKDVSKSVWAVTSPTGKRYLWKCQGARETTNEAENGESGEVPLEGNDDVPERPYPEMIPQVAIVPLPSAQVFATTDPVTKEVLINREDNVTMLKCPDGSYVAEHADGTRITMTVLLDDPSTPLEVMAECPGFARVTHTGSRQCLIHFPDGSKIVCSTTGDYTVEKKDEYQLEVKPCGESHCTLQPTESTAYTFIMDHTGVNDLLVAKGKMSSVKFSIDQDGTPTVSHRRTIPPHPAFSPRYFVVPSNGNPYQIVSQTEMNVFLAAAECQSDTTIVKGEPVPGFEGTTVAVMEGLRRKTPAIMPYKNGSIIPKNLSLDSTHSCQKSLAKGKKRFGVGVGRALSIQASRNKEPVWQVEVPDTLKCRQFVSLDQLNDSSCEQICDGLASYIASRQLQQDAADDLLPVDLRDTSEREAASDLKTEWLTKLSNNILSQALQDVRQQNASKMASKVDLKEPDTRNTTRVLNGIKHDLEQAEHHRRALHNCTVPLYFESDDGKQFLRSQSPDMSVLALQLAQPKPQLGSHHNTAGEVSCSSTPSTLQSASIVLHPVGAESPDVGEVDVVSLSSVSKIRPAHPTPDHAQGMHTPTNVRPTNPTPFHANRVHSPAASIVSQPDTIKAHTLNSGLESDTFDIATDLNAERSVSFILPPRKPSLVVGRTHTVTGSVWSKSQGGIVRRNKCGEIEDTVHRKVRTSSTMTGALVRGFEVQPRGLDFGIIREGCTYVHTLTLKNVGIDACRFKIKQPPPSTGIKVIYTPGPVAAGMSRQCEVEVFAIAVGVVGNSGTGYINHDLEIVSEANMLQIPIQATVLTSSAYDSQQDACPQSPAVGVRRVNRPSSREDFTRPPRAQE